MSLIFKRRNELKNCLLCLSILRDKNKKYLSLMSPKLRDNHNNKLSLILPPPLLLLRDMTKNKMYLKMYAIYLLTFG